jgi:segregation and condensation protein B
MGTLKGSKMLPEDEITARIETILYSSGRPLSLDEIVLASGISSRTRVSRILMTLIDKTKSLFKAIEIARLDDGNYVLQVKSNYTPLVRKFAQRPIISSGALRTLSYIAYEQPLDSRRLLQIRGSQVYDHIRDLLQVGFVEFEKVGRIKIYRTTKKFQIYFGISDFNAMKEKLVISSSKVAINNKS